MVASVNPGEQPVLCCTTANDPGSIWKLVKHLGGDHESWVAYEAGPTGCGIQRQLTELGTDCQVVAPSLMPRRAGYRVQTHSRDTLSLARLLRSGDLTPVWVPGPEDEALRDLGGVRFDARADRLRTTHRPGKSLLGQGPRPSTGGRAWSPRYRACRSQFNFQFRAAWCSMTT